MSLSTLPPLPKTIGTLLDNQANILNEMNPAARVSVANCVTCKGRKSFRWYAPHAVTGRTEADIVEFECPCIDQYLLHRWLSYAGVKKNYQRLGWPDFPYLPADAAGVALDYLDALEYNIDNGVGLIVTGPRGNGKTLLANLILKEAISKGIKGRAILFTEMIDQFASGWKNEGLKTWFEAEVRNAGILLIDDLGREHSKGEGAVGYSMLEGVIRHRVANEKPTIITSNLSKAEIGQGYGGHTFSLLSECSSEISIQGVDRRIDGTMSERRDRERDLRLTRPVVLR